MTQFLTLKPRISEKTYALSEALNVYVFEIPEGTSKQAVASAVAKQYEVSVVSVRTSHLPGKSTRSYRRGGRVVNRGQRSGIRKAFVTLKEGDKLPIFAAVEESSETTAAKEKK